MRSSNHSIFLFIFLLFCSLAAPVYAFDFRVDGIDYNIVSNNPQCVAIEAYIEATGDLVLPSNVRYQKENYQVVGIEPLAFYMNQRITSVHLPETLSYIEESAFALCSNLETIDFPESLHRIGGDAFFNTKWYSKQPNGVVVINDIIYKYKGNLPSGSSLHISDSIRSISDVAFSYCSGLESISLPDSLSHLGNRAFSNSGLESIRIPPLIQSVPIGLCAGCTNLSTIVFHPSITRIEEGAFSGCLHLHEINLPDSLVSIEGFAFSSCTSLERVALPDDTETIGPYAFFHCNALSSVNLNKKLDLVDYAAFLDCRVLTSIVFPSGTRTIGSYAFSYCEKLSSVVFPTKVETIGYNAFDGTDWFFKKPYGMVYIYKVAYSYKGEMPQNTTIRIPEGKTHLCDGAFQDCDGLTTLYLPASLTSIGIEDGVGVFGLCTGLKEVRISAVNPPSAYDFIMDGINLDKITVIVPRGSLDLYRNAPYWCLFSHIEEESNMDIKIVDVDLSQDGPVYDLMGRVRNADSRNEILVKNGRKMINR